MTSLPAAATPEAFDALDLDDPALARAVRRLVGAEVARIRAGSLPVFAVGVEQIIKLYPPCYAAERDHEARWLAALSGALPIPTPPLLDAGAADGWGWIRMGRLAGQPADQRWADIPPGERLRLSAALGEALAALHQLPAAPALASSDWGDFIRQQRRGAEARQRRLGLPEPWAEQIAPFLDRLALDITPPSLVPLHTEIMRQHVFVEEGAGGRWRLTGLLDFEPSTLGARGYELASVGIFWACGEPGLLRAVAEGCGQPTEGLPERVMGWALLHRYSNLPWYLRRMPPPAAVEALPALARRWFAV